MRFKPRDMLKLSAKDKAMLLSLALERSNKLGFDPRLAVNEIIPLTLKQPEKTALGLGGKANWFFAGLGNRIELLFSKLCKEDNLEKFVKRLYRKDLLAYGNAYHLARGIAPKADVFFNALGSNGLQHFKTALRKGKKTDHFLRGLQEILGEKNELYQLAKTKLR